MTAGAALRRLARHRLAQFGLLGGLLFAVAPRRTDDRAIVISADRIAAMLRLEQGRPAASASPSRTRDRVVARLVEDELLIREARRLGLDQDDHILRQRLVQKALFLAEDLGGASRASTQAELRAYHDAHRADYVEDRIDYQLVYAHDPAVLARVRDQVIAHTRAHPHAEPPFGDPLAASRRGQVSLAAFEHEWGAELASAARVLPLGTWSAPIASRRGFQLLLVEQRATVAPPFEALRGRLELELMMARRRAAVAAFLARARERYRIEVAGEPLAGWIGLDRTASHTSPSMED